MRNGHARCKYAANYTLATSCRAGQIALDANCNFLQGPNVPVGCKLQLLRPPNVPVGCKLQLLAGLARLQPGAHTSVSRMTVLRLQTGWTRDAAQAANHKLACSGRVASLRPGAQDWTLDAGHATHWLARLQPGAQDWTLDTGLRNFLHIDDLRLHTGICSREGLVRVHQE